MKISTKQIRYFLVRCEAFPAFICEGCGNGLWTDMDGCTECRTHDTVRPFEVRSIGRHKIHLKHELQFTA